MAGARPLVVAELRAFGRYVTRPRRTIREAAVGTALQRWLIALVAIVVLDLVALLPLGAIVDRTGVTHRLDDVLPALLFALGVLVAPSVEELLFRAGLRSSRYALFIGPGLIGLYAASSWTTGLLAAACCGLGLVALAVRRRRLRRLGAGMAFGRAYLRRFPIVFFGYGAAFGLVHSVNWTSPSVGAALLLPVLTLPQFVFGVVAGYLRIRDSLQSAIALHMASNALVLAAGLAFA